MALGIRDTKILLEKEVLKIYVLDIKDRPERSGQCGFYEHLRATQIAAKHDVAFTLTAHGTIAVTGDPINVEATRREMQFYNLPVDSR